MPMTLTVVIPAKDEDPDVLEAMVRDLRADADRYGIPLWCVLVVVPAGDPVARRGVRGATLVVAPGTSKAEDMNFALARIRTPYVVFIDADVIVVQGQLKLVHNRLLGGEPFVAIPYSQLDWLNPPGYGWYFGANVKTFRAEGGWQDHYVEDYHTVKLLRRKGYTISLVPTNVRFRREVRRVTSKTLAAWFDF